MGGTSTRPLSFPLRGPANVDVYCSGTLRGRISSSGFDNGALGLVGGASIGSVDVRQYRSAAGIFTLDDGAGGAGRLRTTYLRTVTGATFHEMYSNTGTQFVLGDNVGRSFSIDTNNPGGHIRFYADNAVDIGTAANRFREAHTRLLFLSEYGELTEMAAPAAPAANKVRFYAQDNGAGKTQLMALFPSGAAQQVAIEP